MRGSLRFAIHDETVNRFGRDDVVWGVLLRERGVVDTLDLRFKGAPRPRRGTIPPCSLALHKLHSLLPVEADPGRHRRSESCPIASYLRALTSNI
jgi:hypothetical protein